MSTSDPKIILTDMQRHEQAVLGAHRPLIVAEAPAGATAQATIGLPLIGLTLSVNGAYTFLLDTAGLAGAVKVFVKPQFTGSGALTSAGPDGITVALNPRSDTIANAAVITSGTNDGAQSDDTLQTATLTLSGERWVRYTLTHSGTGNATFDVAEYAGV